MRKTKIVATLGPATDPDRILKEMLEAGLDLVRLNFSHGSHQEHRDRIEKIREIEAQMDVNLAVLLDTSGPEIRVGELEGGSLSLEKGQQIALTGREITGSCDQIPLSYKKLSSYLQKDDRVLLDDGLIELKVTEVGEDDVYCRVLNNGTIKSHKGVNIPGVKLDLPSLTAKDREDIRLGIQLDVDYIAASFIRSAGDVIAIRKVIEGAGGDQHIIAKIENQEGVSNIDSILDVADGIMVARGDLGVEIPPERIPALQKSMISKCNKAGKPVITATQMLESMINNPRPTRAEASDVANAIYDGTDATMLSGETAIGSFPVESVRMMANIALQTEESLSYEQSLDYKRLHPPRTVTDSISFSTCDTAHDLKEGAIITSTRSGYTARMVSKYRPRALIVAATPVKRVVKKLKLCWGVYPLLVDDIKNTDQMIDASVQVALDHGLIEEGELVVITAGAPVGVPGTTNLLKVHTAGEVVIRGTGIGKGALSGQVVVAESARQALDKVETGDILVARETDREYMPVLQDVKAIVTERGGLTSHAAVVGIELGIPVIVGASGATEILKDGTIVTVDSLRGLVYHGRARVL